MNKYHLNISEQMTVAQSAFVVTIAGNSKSMGLVGTNFPFSAFNGVKINQLGLFNFQPKRVTTKKGRQKNSQVFTQPITQMVFNTVPEYISLSTWREIMGAKKKPTKKELLDMVVIDFVHSRVGNIREITYTHEGVKYSIQQVENNNSRRG